MAFVSPPPRPWRRRRAAGSRRVRGRELDAEQRGRADDAVGRRSGGASELVRRRQRAGELTGAAPEALAQALLAVLPGFLFQSALLGPGHVAGFPDAVRAIWP